MACGSPEIFDLGCCDDEPAIRTAKIINLNVGFWCFEGRWVGGPNHHRRFRKSIQRWENSANGTFQEWEFENPDGTIAGAIRTPPRLIAQSNVPDEEVSYFYSHQAGAAANVNTWVSDGEFKSVYDGVYHKPPAEPDFNRPARITYYYRPNTEVACSNDDLRAKMDSIYAGYLGRLQRGQSINLNWNPITDVIIEQFITNLGSTPGGVEVSVGIGSSAGGGVPAGTWETQPREIVPQLASNHPFWYYGSSWGLSGGIGYAEYFPLPNPTQGSEFFCEFYSIDSVKTIMQCFRNSSVFGSKLIVPWGSGPERFGWGRALPNNISAGRPACCGPVAP